MAICSIRWGLQASISSGAGSRFSGGRHFTTLAMYTSCPRQPDAAEKLGEELARLSHERLALPVFVKTRTFTHEHQVGLRASYPEHDLGAAPAQSAACALAQGVGQAPAVPAPPGSRRPPSLRLPCRQG